MSMGETVEVARAKIYDEKQRTRIPDRMAEIMNIEKGDEIKFVHDGDNCGLFVEKADEDGSE